MIRSRGEIQGPEAMMSCGRETLSPWGLGIRVLGQLSSDHDAAEVRTSRTLMGMTGGLNRYDAGVFRTLLKPALCLDLTLSTLHKVGTGRTPVSHVGRSRFLVCPLSRSVLLPANRCLRWMILDQAELHVGLEGLSLIRARLR